MCKIFYLFIPLSLAMTFASCDKDDPEIPHEEELITTLIYTLTPLEGGESIVFSFKDLDGDGGEEPLITTGPLEVNKTYRGSVQVRNDVENPVEDITVEIAEESAAHQFFYSITTDEVNITYYDADENGYPVGLSTLLTTGNVATGQLTITLRHEPNKSASGVSSGDISNAGGETDIEVTFPLNVE